MNPARRSPAGRRRPRGGGLAVGLLVGVLVPVAACAPGEDSIVADEPVTDPARVRAEPAQVAPGEQVEVVFPDRDDRGPGFVVERRHRGQWRWRWAVHSEPPGQPRVRTAEEWLDGGYAWEGPGYDDDTAHPIPVPPDAPAGTYRVCTARQAPPLCATFDVEANR